MRLEIVSKYPVEDQRPTPILFIHGALHGAWCWDVHFLDYFRPSLLPCPRKLTAPDSRPGSPSMGSVPSISSQVGTLPMDRRG